jgi:NitT/TauT family transport system ATP-binding protein
LLPWTSVWNNVYLPLRLRGVSKSAAKAQIDEAVTLVGLQGFEHAYPRELSGGMKMRASVARALVTRPQLLLLDEPFAALDAQTRVVIQNDVVKICRAGRRSMLIVTHDIAEALAMADRVVVLSRRPASVKEVYEVPFSREAASVADAPAMPGFADYYKRIWDALDISVTGMAAAA